MGGGGGGGGLFIVLQRSDINLGNKRILMFRNGVSSLPLPHSQVVSMVMLPEWINTVSYIPLLRYSVLAPFLSEYIPDGVGISPTTVHHPSWEVGGATQDATGKKLSSKCMLASLVPSPTPSFSSLVKQGGPGTCTFTHMSMT